MISRGHDSWRQSTVAKTEVGGRPLRLNEFVELCRILEMDSFVTLTMVTAEDDIEATIAERRLAVQYARERASEASALAEVAAAEFAGAQHRLRLAEAMRTGTAIDTSSALKGFLASDEEPGA